MTIIIDRQLFWLNGQNGLFYHLLSVWKIGMVLTCCIRTRLCIAKNQCPLRTGITVFAPTNAAFKAAGYVDEDAIKATDPKVLANLLSYHVLNYRAYQQTFQNGSDVVTAQGGSLRFTVTDGKVTSLGKGNGTTSATITQGDLSTTNGVVHIIDRVLLP